MYQPVCALRTLFSRHAVDTPAKKPCGAKIALTGERVGPAVPAVHLVGAQFLLPTCVCVLLYPLVLLYVYCGPLHVSVFSLASTADIRIPLEWREFESQKGKLGKLVGVATAAVLVYMQSTVRTHTYVRMIAVFIMHSWYNLCVQMYVNCRLSHNVCACARPHHSVPRVLLVQDGT